MTELILVSLENEMDLTLAYKRSISTLSLLGLTISTQTTFATAVSEVCREVIDKADQGVFKLGVDFKDGRYLLIAEISFRTTDILRYDNPGIDYARKLVPILEVTAMADFTIIYLSLSIPRSTRLDQQKVKAVRTQIEQAGPVSAYEEVKLKNAALLDLNQQNEEALQQASELDKLKTEFLSVASHELNSPLTILLGLSQLAKSKSAAIPLVYNILSKVEDQTRKIISLVRQLMDVSKFEHGVVAYDQQIIPIQTFFDEIRQGISLLAPKHKLSLLISCEGNLYADSLRLEQVITNLVNNAAKYSALESEIVLKSYIENDKLIISVADQGMGMSEETKSQIFEKFFREKRVEKKYNGLGMGLYIVNRIISDHNGEISVESELGKGSVFSVALPLHQSETA